MVLLGEELISADSGNGRVALRLSHVRNHLEGVLEEKSYKGSQHGKQLFLLLFWMGKNIKIIMIGLQRNENYRFALV